jgi:hypothetical protein
VHPQARHDDVLVEELDGETLVYDLRRHKAHCLNPTAAFVWRRCDGHTSVAEIAALLPGALSVPAEEALVWLALQRLEQLQLLRAPVLAQAPAGALISRRMMLRRLGVAGGAALVLPVVTSITVPTPAMAASPIFINHGGDCSRSGECLCEWIKLTGKMEGKMECLSAPENSGRRCSNKGGTCAEITEGNIHCCYCKGVETRPCFPIL